MEKIFSKLVVKEIDDDRRTIRGVATTPRTDRMNDIVRSSGVQFSLPIPLLWQHDHHQPIGSVTSAKVTDEGIEIEAELPQVNGPSRLAARLNEAWESIKSGLVRGLSIGFSPIEYNMLDNGGIEFTKWDWHELSAVTIPANAEASITNIKRFSQPAVSGNGGVSKAASGVKLKSTKPKQVKTMDYAEQLEKLRANIEAHEKRMNEIQEQVSNEERTKTTDEKAEFGRLSDEVKAMKDEIADIEKLQKSDASTAKPVEDKAKSSIVTVKKNLAGNGLAFAQYVRSLAAAQGNKHIAAQIAKQQADAGAIDHRVAAFAKAAVSGATTDDAAWAGNLVHNPGEIVQDFVTYLRDRTIIGQFGQDGIPALRAGVEGVPINQQTSAGSADWVGEGHAKPVTSWGYSKKRLETYKLAAIAVASDELLRKASLQADTMLRDELARAVAEKEDETFIGTAAGTATTPAGILNGASTQASDTTAGATVQEKFEADFNYLVSQMISAKIPFASMTLVMSSSNAFGLSRQRDSLGNLLYPTIGMSGGTLSGIPVLVSDYIGDTVALIAASEIYLVGGGGVEVKTSNEASIEMADNPAGDSGTPTGASLVSMFQTNSQAFLVEERIGWESRRSAAVAYVTAADYTAPNAAL